MIVESYTVRIWIAGDYDSARRCARQFAMNEGACFAITKVDYVYTGGEESGVCATLIHYPRFPSTPNALWDKAGRFAALLAKELYQKTYSIEAPDRTEWFQVGLPGAPV